MPNTTVFCNSTLSASSPLGYTGSTAFHIHTGRITPLRTFTSGQPPGSKCTQLCWTLAVNESSPCSHPQPHSSCPRDPSSQIPSCNSVPFPTMLQTSVLRRPRSSGEGTQKRCCREEWVSQQLESQRHWRERKIKSRLPFHTLLLVN